MAKNGLDKGWDIDNDKIKTYYLDLLKFRPISNQIVETFNVHHQSPQVIVIANEKIIHTESHHGIDIKKIQQLIK